jgi:hypothetical protein
MAPIRLKHAYDEASRDDGVRRRVGKGNRGGKHERD